MLGKIYKLLSQRKPKKKKLKKTINQKTLDSVFNTVFINPDVYFKGTRLYDPERSKNESCLISVDLSKASRVKLGNSLISFGYSVPIYVWIYENHVKDFAPKSRVCFWKIGQKVYIYMAMSYWECYLPRVLLIESLPCLYKPLKSLQMSRTNQTKLN